MISVPEAFAGTLAEANHYCEIGRYAEAREKYLTLLQVAPEDGELFYKIAFCEYHLRRMNEAVEHSKEAMRFGYRTPAVYSLLGLLCRMQEMHTLSEQLLTEGLSAFPNNVELRAQYAYLLWSTGRKRQARTLLNEALSINPTDQVALYYKFHMKHGFGSQKQRAEIIQQLMQSNVTEVDRLMLISTHLFKSKKYHSARDKCREAFVLAPTNIAIIQQLEQLEMICHPIYFANRLVSRIGVKVYRIAIPVILVVLLLLQSFALYSIAFSFFLLIMIWTRTSKPMYRWLKRRWK